METGKIYRNVAKNKLMYTNKLNEISKVSNFY